MGLTKFKHCFFSVLGWKSKGLKSKGHFKSKGHSKSKGVKAFKGTKVKSYIHKGLTKKSAEPWGHYLKGDWDSSKGFYWRDHSLKGKTHSLKGKVIIHVGLTKIIRKLSIDGMICLSLKKLHSENGINSLLNIIKIGHFLDPPFADVI